MSTPEKALTKRQQQAKLTKKKIYDATVSLVEKIDFEEIKISEICKLAQVSVGSFYTYYNSKEEIILSTAEDFDTGLDAKLWAFEENGMSEVEKIVELACEPARSAVQRSKNSYIQFVRVVLKTRSTSYISAMRVIDKQLRVYAQRAIEAGEIYKDASAEEIAEGAMIIVRGTLFDWVLRENNYDVEQQTRRTILQYLKSYRTNPEINSTVIG